MVQKIILTQSPHMLLLRLLKFVEGKIYKKSL